MHLPHKSRLDPSLFTGNSQQQNEAYAVCGALTDAPLLKEKEKGVQRLLARMLEHVREQGLRGLLTCGEWSMTELPGFPVHRKLTGDLTDVLQVWFEHIEPTFDGYDDARTIPLNRQFGRVSLSGKLDYEVLRPSVGGKMQSQDSGILEPGSSPLFCVNPDPDSYLRFKPLEDPVLLMAIVAERELYQGWNVHCDTKPVSGDRRDRFHREVLDAVS